jgi:hypothetical protein
MAKIKISRMEPKYMPEDLQRGINKAKENIKRIEDSARRGIEKEMKLIAEYEFLKVEAEKRIQREKAEAQAGA